MDTKEIIISFIILITLLAGFFVLIRLGGQKEAKTEAVEGTAQAPTTQDLSNENQLKEGSSLGSDVLKEELPVNNDELVNENMQNTNQNQNSQPRPPQMQLKQGVDYQAVINTSMGTVRVDLFENLAPLTVNNFVYLARNDFYDGLIFHRVIENFMIQGGDPTGTGSGGPGYSFQDEINNRKIVRGSLAMANAGPNTNGSQFFIVTAEATPHLDGRHTNFGQVLEGMEVVDTISKVETGQNDRPLNNILINSVEIIEN